MAERGAPDGAGAPAFEPLRLQPGDDLRAALTALLVQRDQQAGFVVAGIGSLSAAAIRCAGRDAPLVLSGDLEVLTLSGSLAPAGAHLHISVSDAAGRVVGGHVAQGCIVRTTLEAMVAWLPDWRFDRVADAATGYRELAIRRRASP